MTQTETKQLIDEIAEALNDATNQLYQAVMGGKINSKVVGTILEREALAKYEAAKPEKYDPRIDSPWAD